MSQQSQQILSRSKQRMNGYVRKGEASTTVKSLNRKLELVFDKVTTDDGWRMKDEEGRRKEEGGRK